jgi:DNA-binding NarL/FixJ family response regulator
MLTPRERLVVHLIAEGHSNKEISKIINLSVKTIESHRATAMRKLNVTSTAAIVRYAIPSSSIRKKHKYRRIYRFTARCR